MANTFVRSGYILAILFAIVVAATGNLLSLSCIIGSIVQVIELIKIKILEPYIMTQTNPSGYQETDCIRSLS